MLRRERVTTASDLQRYDVTTCFSRGVHVQLHYSRFVTQQNVAG